MFALGIRYLTGYATATDAANREAVEWPPHPARVFMAMAAAWFETGRDAHERDAIEWLEKAGAPALRVPQADARSTVTAYVPANDEQCHRGGALQSALGLPRIKQPRTFPKARLCNGGDPQLDECCHLIWPDAEPPAELESPLEQVCGKVTRIGHSASLVQMWVVRDTCVAPNWHPDETDAEIHLRHAGEGFLNYLAAQFKSDAVLEYDALQFRLLNASVAKERNATKRELREKFNNKPPILRRPSVSLWQGYRRAATDSNIQTVHRSLFSPSLIILRLAPVESKFRNLHSRATLQVAARLREALLSISGEIGIDPIPSLISGHEPDGSPLQRPHLAVLPLIFCGHPHATGASKGIGLALPEGTTDADRAALVECLACLRERGLKMGPLGLWTLRRETATDPPRTLLASTWTGGTQGASVWATVTPIALDRHAKAKDKEAHLRELAEIIRGSCENAGLPNPAEVTVLQVGRFPGLPASRDFPRIKRKDGGQRRHTHAVLRFNDAVAGPVILGAGRYRGYGLCRPFFEAGGAYA